MHTLEAYAVCLSVLHFKRILLGQEFTVYTDHKSLEHWLLGRPLTERHAKMLVKLQDFSFKIVYVKGEDNVLADFASRPPNNGKSGFDEVRKELDAAAVTAGIRMDLKFLVREHNDQEFVLEDPRIKEDRLELKDDIYYYTLKEGDEPVILVPPELRAELIEEVHNLAHMGVTRCLRELRRSCFWPGMYADVKGYVSGWEECLKFKKTIHEKYPAQHLECTNRWRVLHIDLVGPFPKSRNGNSQVLIMIYRYSQWVRLMSVDDTTSLTIASAVFRGWIVLLGCPK